MRVVYTNGASVFMPVPWQQPGPGLRVTTKFMDVDYMTHENFTGKSSQAKKVGRRAQFENKFASSTPRETTAK